MSRAKKENIIENNESKNDKRKVNVTSRKILYATIFGALAFLAIIALLAIMSQPAEATPILDLDIQDGQTYSKHIEPDTTVTWTSTTNDALYCTNDGTTSSTVNLTITSLPQYWTANIQPSQNIKLGSGGGSKLCELTVWCPENQTDEPAGLSITIKMRDNDNDLDVYLSVTVIVDQVYGVGLTPDASSKSVLPGEDTHFILNVSNTGNGQDSIVMNVTGARPGWNCWFDQNPVTIEAFSYRNDKKLTCDVPEGELKGSYPLSITATSENGAPSWTIGVSVVVNQTYSVSLSADYSNKQILPGETINYNVTLENKGNGVDSFTITKSTVPSGWTLITAGSPIDIDPGATSPISVTLIASSDALKNEVVIFNVNATTGGPSPQTFPLELTAIVSQVYKIDMTGIVLTRNLLPDDIGIFKVNVTNKGNGEDTIDIEVTGFPAGWPLPNIDSVGELGPDEFKIIEITVTAGSDALNQPYYFYVNITSEGDSTKTRYRQCTVQVNQTFDVNLVVLQDTKFTEPEQQITFTLQVTNDGNGVDNIELDDGDVFD
ncbi:MAG: hypothetical protein JSV56_11640, partial [Methanomassiliicoccales archaeon]